MFRRQKFIKDMPREFVVLVDDEDNQIGLCEKLDAHKYGLLHRAFSIFIFNEDKKLLMQQRAFTKYHSGGLWSNTVCSHPRDGEGILLAAKRRLMEEMGIEAMDLHCIFSFIYRLEVSDELIEHEYDHVLIGYFSDIPNINRKEVNNWKYVSISNLETEILINENKYTPWFRIALPKIVDHI